MSGSDGTARRWNRQQARTQNVLQPLLFLLLLLLSPTKLPPSLALNGFILETKSPEQKCADDSW